MGQEQEIVKKAKALNKEKRKQIITSFKETDLHHFLKDLFEKMEPSYNVEITHGSEELGKDLVIVKQDTISTDVIGIVVKKGDIRAKTIGDVDEIIEKVNTVYSKTATRRIDEIKSQVQQAFNNPAELKTIFNSLPVTKVIVILAGEISRGARKRIKNEIKTAIQIFDLNWLIDNFTNYYPQVFFEGEIIDFLQKQIQKLETEFCLFKKDRTLSECFIEPFVSTVDFPGELEEDNLSLLFNFNKLPFSYLKSVLSKRKKVILIGDPGTGKSSALAKLEIDILNKAYNDSLKLTSNENTINIPIFINANDISKAKDHNELKDNYFVSKGTLDRFNVKALLVDALDEVPSKNRKEVLDKSVSFSNELNASLVITSRKVEIIKENPPSFEKYELLPFEINQALNLFKKLIQNKKMLDTLSEGLEKIKFQIPMVPLSLMFLIQLVEENKEIPASVTELYDRFLDMILGRWDRDKGIEVLFEYHIKKKFLGELAHNEFYKKNKLEINLQDFKEFCKTYTDKYNFELKSFIKEIERTGILEIKDEVYFSHRSFLDYFIAFYIFENRAEISNLEKLLLSLFFNDTWSEVAFFYCGLRREITETFLKEIMKYDNEDLSTVIDKFLVGRLLQAGWHSTNAAKLYGIKKAFNLVPIIRSKMSDATRKKKVEIPKIFINFFVMMLSDFAFGSAFLQKETKSFYNEYNNQNSYEQIYISIALLWSFYKFLSKDELKRSVDKILDDIANVKEANMLEQATIFILLMIIEKGDKVIYKSLNKRIKKMKKKYPSIFKELLPIKKRGA